jgi:hypothetical protein
MDLFGLEAPSSAKKIDALAGRFAPSIVHDIVSNPGYKLGKLES